ncbi:hypothetical protein L6475_13935 [Prevotella sp. E9-3]|uniref:hypothetical protein n=1 Tax=Prevotella sp. E9-3 TaxID=2913621 RepID=UPI001EDC1435|nr:hypothetical protein [Prevotella sp. E9-3]UKK48280.1 hypothetical protein L6475_13935 [Prevotella sp. E9-3]
MKRLFQILAVTLLSATLSELCAQHNWAMAFVEKGQDIPTVVEYHSAQETAENGIVYNRIFDGTRLKSKVCWLLISYNTLFLCNIGATILVIQKQQLLFLNIITYLLKIRFAK